MTEKHRGEDIKLNHEYNQITLNLHAHPSKDCTDCASHPSPNISHPRISMGFTRVSHTEDSPLGAHSHWTNRVAFVEARRSTRVLFQGIICRLWRRARHSCSSIQKAGPKILNDTRNNICTNYLETVPAWVKVLRTGKRPEE